MKSRTSFFNSTVLVKDITRFAPVWVLYSLLLLIVAVFCANGGTVIIPTLGYYSYQSTSFAQNLATTLMGSGVVCCGYALLNAQLLFGDLFKSRLCNALHALPIRREGWFATHVVSGLLLSLVPNALMMAGCAIYMETMKDMAVYWFLAVTMQYLFYFGLAVFCVMCVGSRVGMAVVYGLCSFGAWLLHWLVSTLYIPLMPGIGLSFAFFSPYCPLAYGISHPPVSVAVEYHDYGVQYGDIKSEVLTLNGDNWVYLVVIAAVGLALLAGALMMYRKRDLESAGDFIAANWLKPVFLVAYTLAVGALFEYFLDFTQALGWIFLAVGLIVGYISGLMFLNRTIRVLNKRSLAGFAALTAVLGGTMGLTALDPLDLEHWVPDPAQVTQVYMDAPGHWYYGLEQDEDDVRGITQLHQTILDEGNVPLETTTITVTDPYDPTWNYSYTEYVDGYEISLYYQLDNGISLSRTYTQRLDSPATDQLIRLLSRPENVLAYYHSNGARADVDEMLAAIDYSSFRIKTERLFVYPSEAENRALIEAILADCEAGTMAQHDYFHEGGGYELTVRWGQTAQASYGSFSIMVYPDAVNTMQWLEGQSFYQEYLAGLEAEETE